MRNYQDVFDVTLSLDTSAYAGGDLLADTQLVSADAFIEPTGGATLASVVVIDEDDNKQPFTLIFLSASTSLGTENSALNITDALARNVIGLVEVTAADYKDLGGASVADVPLNPKVLRPATGATSLYVAAVLNGSGTPTYTASGMRLKIGLLY